jgi:hypothetical protein
MLQRDGPAIAPKRRSLAEQSVGRFPNKWIVVND